MRYGVWYGVWGMGCGMVWGNSQFSIINGMWVDKIHEFSLPIAHSIASAEKTMRSRGFANRLPHEIKEHISLGSVAKQKKGI